ncbi:hypothetical protein GOP47_0015848 [Adiantum capillus-veneris]|uniref:Uncharacterized protein n=1 Tax=Adiantum capillus-veneris TaxID=13818 RepID=A0A9D4ZD01_ADICA|nr:hypothetical protein GOP47_0015848 [Adiantum capillus-veneris]
MFVQQPRHQFLSVQIAFFIPGLNGSKFCAEDECVESQPLCLNIRKPLERKVAGLLTFRAPTRPLPLLPIMMTSPWIQHFKSQRNRSLQNARFQDKDAEPLNAKEIQKKDLRTSSHSSSSEHGPESSYGSAYKKREFAKVTQSSEYKKQRCQHFALSHMDILMEQQYNEEQHRKMGETDDIEDGQMEPNLVTGFKQKEAASNCTVDGVLSQKPDQVVPSIQSVDKEACAKVALAGLQGDEEDAHCAAMAEPESVTSTSGSKTWTWGIQGPRYHVVKQTTAHACHS